jgi:hypothetical protein
LTNAGHTPALQLTWPRRIGYIANALLVLYVQVVDPSAGMGMGLGAAAAAPAAQAARRPANMEAYVIDFKS